MKNLGGGELESLLAEARKIETLRGHKNIVEMYETFVEDDEGFLVMEYVEGRSLQDIFQAHARLRTWLDTEEALDYFCELLTLRVLPSRPSRTLTHTVLWAKSWPMF